MTRYDNILAQSDRELAGLVRYIEFKCALLGKGMLSEETRRNMTNGRPNGWRAPYFNPIGSSVGFIPPLSTFLTFKPHNRVRIEREIVELLGGQAITRVVTEVHPMPSGQVCFYFQSGMVRSFQLFSSHCFTDYGFGDVHTNVFRPSDLTD